MFEMRPLKLELEDYDKLAKLLAASHSSEPQRNGDEWLWMRNNMLGSGPVGDLVVEGDEGFIGAVRWCGPWWIEDFKKLVVWLSVHPAWRRKGLGSELLARLVEEAERLSRRELEGMVAEDDTESRAFVENRGFEIRVRFEQSGFHTHKTLPADAIARLAQVQASGIEILDGDGLANRFPDDWRERWWRLNEESRVDMTGPDQQEARTYEKFARIFRLPGFARDLFHFAVDGDEVVGLTGLKGHPADLRFVHVFMTGVARSHRRRGLATALKTRSLQLAVERGFDLVKTENEESNQTYQINLALGFEALPASLLYGAQVSTLR